MMRTKAKSVDFWMNCIIGQTKHLPQCPEDEANIEIALILLKNREQEKRKVA